MPVGAGDAHMPGLKRLAQGFEGVVKPLLLGERIVARLFGHLALELFELPDQPRDVVDARRALEGVLGDERVRETALAARETKPVELNLGVRGDVYRGLSAGLVDALLNAMSAALTIRVTGMGRAPRTGCRASKDSGVSAVGGA